VELEVIWSGRKQDGYLCIPPPEVRDLSHVQPMSFHDTPSSKRLYRTRTDRSRMRQKIREILRMRGTMTVKDLRKRVGDKDTQFYNVLTRMVRHGQLESPERGIVRMAVQRPQEAA
jgi:hypothetical protein